MPAEKIWVYKDLHCMAYLHPMRHRCGYAGIPPSHLWFRINYDLWPISVHGGLTYGAMSESKDDECHAVGLYWVGFDCGHSGDSGVNEDRPAGHVWTLEEVIAETNDMADQIDRAKDIKEFWLSKRMEEASAIIWKIALHKYECKPTQDAENLIRELINEIQKEFEPKSIPISDGIRHLEID